MVHRSSRLQDRLPPPSHERVWTHRCDNCGVTMIEKHCKIRCLNCGFVRDCSDP